MLRRRCHCIVGSAYTDYRALLCMKYAKNEYLLSVVRSLVFTLVCSVVDKDRASRQETQGMNSGQHGNTHVQKAATALYV